MLECSTLAVIESQLQMCNFTENRDTSTLWTQNTQTRPQVVSDFLYLWDVLVGLYQNPRYAVIDNGQSCAAFFFYYFDRNLHYNINFNEEIQSPMGLEPPMSNVSDIYCFTFLTTYHFPFYKIISAPPNN